MKQHLITPVISLFSFIALLASHAGAQDLVALEDGRFVIGPKMTRTTEGVTIHYENGDVKIKKDMVREASVSKYEGVESDETEEEKANKAKGLVRFEGKWVKAKLRDRKLTQRRTLARRRIHEAMKHRKWRDRYKLTTRNFAFEYTIDPDKMKEYANLMETYYKVFLKEWGIRKPAGMGKLRVCFYHDEEYYYQVSGAPRGAIGYFRFVAPIELNYYYNRLDERQTIDVMFHETNHYLTHLVDPKFNYPSWINESLAEFYGASEWDPKRKKMSVGNLQEGRLAVIQSEIKRDQMQGLEELMRMEKSGFTALHYAWGWSFVHFLLTNKKYEKPFKRFYLALARDKKIKTTSGFRGFRTIEADEVIRVFKRHLKVKDLSDLEKKWHDYVRGLEQTGHRGWALGGRIFLNWGMPIKAQRFFRTAIERGNTNPLTFYSLGQALERKRRYDEAAEAYKEAIERDPLNGIFYIRLAQAMGRATGDKDSDDVKRLKKLAFEIEPENPEIIRSLAMDEDLEDLLGKGGS